MESNRNRSSLRTCLNPAVREAGCDEAGRGCLAGPVVAAAVILPPDFYHPLLNDSKKLTERQRNLLRPVIEQQALAWAVAEVDHTEIERINILNASILAMHLALDMLPMVPDEIVVDGNRFKPWRQGVRHTTVVHGDALLANIAAASVLAKTRRDMLMEQLHRHYPLYGWDVNKGYPTAAHRRAIALHGPSPLHRMTFRLTKD